MTRPCQRPECRHEPRGPAADAPDHAAARVIASYPVQGWSLLCNGVVVFDDAGELLPSGVSVAPGAWNTAARGSGRPVTAGDRSGR